jgi:hypothetical protein
MTDALWEIVAGSRNGVLATVEADESRHLWAIHGALAVDATSPTCDHSPSRRRPWSSEGLRSDSN